MSRNIEQVNGEIIETIADMTECKNKWNDLCCDDRSAEFATRPGNYCDLCPFFTREDGNVNR